EGGDQRGLEASRGSPRAGRRQRRALGLCRGERLMAELNILEGIRGAMEGELERVPNVMVLGEDVGKKGGVFGATDGVWAKYGGKRVLDTPLSEAMIAGAAA